MENHTPATRLGNRDFFIRLWEAEYPVFKDVFEALPAAQLNYRPHSASRSAGELVALLVAVELSCVELCKVGRSSYSNGMRWHPTSGFSSLDQMIAAYGDHHRAFVHALTGLDDDTWNYPAWLIRGEQEIIHKDSLGGLLWIALFDAVHHRGQLSTYIRPMGGKVPSIYGPSADSPTGC